MVNINGLTSNRLEASHVGGAMGLVQEAGWNQLPADWHLMTRCGEAMVLQNADNEVCATAFALPYPADFGWVSMVLVAKSFRRQGIATELLADRISWLRQRNLVPILDATEAGEQVYSKLGFSGGISITRWQGEGTKQKQKFDPDHDTIINATEDCYDWIQSLDAEVFGAERPGLIADFLHRAGSKCLVRKDSRSGFIIIREGSRAAQIGPVIADNESEAIALLDAALARQEGPLFFDLQDARVQLSAHVAKLGFEKQRSFVRMSMGEMPDFDGNGRAMIIAGPEYG